MFNFDLIPDLLLLIIERVELLDELLDETLEEIDSFELTDSLSSMLLFVCESKLTAERARFWLLLLADRFDSASWLTDTFLGRIWEFTLIIYLDRLVESDEEDDEETVEIDDLFKSGCVNFTYFQKKWFFNIFFMAFNLFY